MVCNGWGTVRWREREREREEVTFVFEMFEELVKMIEVGDLWTRMTTQWPVGIHRGSVDMGLLASRTMIIQIVYNEDEDEDEGEGGERREIR